MTKLKEKIVNRDDLEEILENVRYKCQEKGLQPSSTKARIRRTKIILENLKSFEPKAISKFLIEFKDSEGKILSQSGQNTWKKHFRWLSKNIKLFQMSSDHEELLRTKNVRSPGKLVALEDVEKILSLAPSTEAKLAFIIVLECALRPHEVTALRIKDIEIDEDGIMWLHVPEKKRDGKTSTKTGNRIVPVKSERAKNDLLSHLLLMDKPLGSQSFLLQYKARSLATIFCRMKNKFKEETQRNFSDNARCYDLRHTGATEYSKIGNMPDQLLKSILGWTPGSKMPDIYVHLQDEKSKQAYRELKFKNIQEYDKEG